MGFYKTWWPIVIDHSVVPPHWFLPTFSPWFPSGKKSLSFHKSICLHSKWHCTVRVQKSVLFHSIYWQTIHSELTETPLLFQQLVSISEVWELLLSPVLPLKRKCFFSAESSATLQVLHHTTMLLAADGGSRRCKDQKYELFSGSVGWSTTPNKEAIESQELQSRDSFGEDPLFGCFKRPKNPIVSNAKCHTAILFQIPKAIQKKWR